ncbi:MAG: MaoC family dehydratase N-terminal domain-containing protein, partial [Alphaproteobacteria bacterium]|nr:MaoC family dehydratase N-terminal domain-containing protein [Alphaproteobacteria bacterium]
MTAYTSFEELEIGRVFPDPPANFQITEAQVAAYLMATGDESTVYREDPSRPIPPMFAAVYMLDAIAHLRNPPGGIHTKQRFTFHQPVHIGDRLTID